ncbi:helix-turn-helix domain-containing protein [Escherichia coli]|nr:helix-turn-helix domain-containing protein [Escherichia coli]ELQ4184713.1 helix-turn-helix domain-containing protein [Escherichia coli]
MLKTLTINAITQYIDDNLENLSIDINTLVEYSGYSRRYLQLLFKENIGITVGKYIQLRRATRAATLLRFTGLNIADISERLFYDSQQTFTREFKKICGYTPLQYRKNKIWFFKNMLGRREVKNNLPTPEIRHLERKIFHGQKVSYKETLPVTDPLAKPKWSTVDSFLSETNKPFYISHKFETEKIDNKNMYFYAIFWDCKGDNNTEGVLEEGFYAYFSFNGTRDDYRMFIYNTYMNTLPFYGLQKKDSYDLEIITRMDDNICFYEYYLPLENEDVDLT